MTGWVAFLAGPVLAGLNPPCAHAQGGGPIQVIVPYAPGGSSSTIGRLLSEQLARQIERQILIINQPGAAGTVGAGNVARAKPDGGTLLFTTSGITIAQTLKKSPALDVRHDLAPIIATVESSMGFYVNPALPINNTRELIEYAKANPGRVNYASSGVGSSAHLYSELFKNMAGVDMTHVPFSTATGPGQALAVIRGDVQLLIADSLGSPRAMAAAGRLRLIAVGSARRSPVFPDIPTVAESGVPGYDIAYWLGYFAPAATPPETVERLNAAVAAVLAAPAMHERLLKQGYAVIPSTVAEFKSRIGGEVAKWEKLVRDANIPRE